MGAVTSATSEDATKDVTLEDAAAGTTSEDVATGTKMEGAAAVRKNGTSSEGAETGRVRQVEEGTTRELSVAPSFSWMHSATKSVATETGNKCNERWQVQEAP